MSFQSSCERLTFKYLDLLFEKSSLSLLVDVLPFRLKGATGTITSKGIRNRDRHTLSVMRMKDKPSADIGTLPPLVAINRGMVQR